MPKARKAAASFATNAELAIWRSATPEEIGAAALDAIRASLLSGPVRLLHPRWPAAARGDAAAAVGIAVDNLHDVAGSAGAATDLAMTALLPHACGGNPAAALVMAHALAALAHSGPEPHAARVAEAWAKRGPPMDLRRVRRPR